MKTPLEKVGFFIYISVMENNKDRKYLGYLIWLVFILLMTHIILKIRNDIQERNQQLEKQKKELKIHKNVDDKVVGDTMISQQTESKTWPIRVQSVEKSDEKNTPKWQVIAENGVMYYTNKKPRVGDIAFYLNDNDEITDKYGNGVERTR